MTTDSIINGTTSMVAPWHATVQPVIEDLMCVASVPGMLIAVAQGEHPPQHLVVGIDAAGRPLTADTLFPVASITKLATALAVLRLAAVGMLAIDDPLACHLPDAAAAQDGVTLRALLCHTGGLPDDVTPELAPYTPGLDWPALARACLATPLVTSPWTCVHYSNLGPGLLAIVIERLTGQPFPAALADLVLKPLNIDGTLGGEPSGPTARMTGELGEHAGTELEPYNSTFWRALGLPWGGLVTTAVGALALVHAFTGVPSGFLPPALLAEATHDQTGGLAGGLSGIVTWTRCPWGLGVELRGDKMPHWVPASASPTSFGHAGASGCLAWVDPAAGVAWAMLGTHTFERWWTRWAAIGAAILAAID